MRLQRVEMGVDELAHATVAEESDLTHEKARQEDARCGCEGGGCDTFCDDRAGSWPITAAIGARIEFPA